MDLSFYPIDATYDIVDNKPRVKLYGRTVSGKQILVLDSSFRPYFYVDAQPQVKQQLQTLRVDEDSRTFEVIQVDQITKELNGKEVALFKVTVNVPPAVPRLREMIKQWSGVNKLYEYDILYARRYLIDKGIVPMTETVVQGTMVSEGNDLLVIDATKLEHSKQETYRAPKMLAVDIETYSPFNQQIDYQKNPILSIGFSAPNYKKVFIWKKLDTQDDSIEYVEDEKALIKKFVQVVKDHKPDILTGYFSDGFDLPYLRARADKFGIKLTIGPDGAEPKLKTGNEQAVQITGLAHLDIFKFIKRVMRGTLETEAFSLNAVAKELLGEEKHDVDLSELPTAWDTSDLAKLELFAKYNIQDADLAYRLSEKLLPSIIEMVKIVGLTIYDINRMGFSQLIEWYLLKQAPLYNQLAPNKPSQDELLTRKERRIAGAFVFEPKPGLYKDIAVYDYLSLYPTIISSHNLGPGTIVAPDSDEPAEVVPGQPYRFSTKRKGFLPKMIEGIISVRLGVKEQMKTATGDELRFLDAQQGGLKLMANSFYGYLGFFGARWYSKESAESTTAWGRHHIKDVIAKAQEQGFGVIYSDTDSVFLSLEGKEKSQATTFVDKINEGLPGLMELEFEGYYPTGIFVSSKGSEGGAKKKYALCKEDNTLKIKGFETVRRNWAYIAKETQEQVLNILLVEQDTAKAKTFVRQVIADLKEKKTPVDKLIIRMQLVKELSDYAAKGPHVAVAQRLQSRGEKVGPGTIISYVVGIGSDTVRDRARLPDEIQEGKYDADYYITHQVVPSVGRIFDVLGVTEEELTSDTKQQSLAGFF